MAQPPFYDIFFVATGKMGKIFFRRVYCEGEKWLKKAAVLGGLGVRGTRSCRGNAGIFLGWFLCCFGFGFGL